MSMRHVLKCQLKQFAATWDGSKTADLRNFDRPFRVGDLVCLREYDHERDVYSGREIEAMVSHVISRENQCALSQAAIAPDYCILSLKIMLWRPAL